MIVIIFLTQSKLGYLAFLLTLRKNLNIAQALFFLFIISVAFIYADLGEFLYHIASFAGDFQTYIANNKRSREFLWVVENYDLVLFSGTNQFSVDSLTSHAESSIISYIVKVGLLSTIVYWIGFGLLCLKHRFGLFFSLILMFSLFAAPLDRPKLALFLLYVAPLISLKMGEVSSAIYIQTDRRAYKRKEKFKNSSY
jgi:hypothetical protein